MPQTSKVVVANFYHRALQLMVKTFRASQILQTPFANSLVKLQGGGSGHTELATSQLGRDVVEVGLEGEVGAGGGETVRHLHLRH